MFSKVVKNDEYYTKKESWADIAQYLPRDKVIWECFILSAPKALNTYVSWDLK